MMVRGRGGTCWEGLQKVDRGRSADTYSPRTALEAASRDLGAVANGGTHNFGFGAIVLQSGGGSGG